MTICQVELLLSTARFLREMASTIDHIIFTATVTVTVTVTVIIIITTVIGMRAKDQAKKVEEVDEV